MPDRSRLVAALFSLGLTACPAARPAPATVISSTPTPVTHPEVVAAITKLPGAPASAEWDEGVREALLAAFDQDRSGSIDRVVEVRAISCDVWKTLERANESSQYRVGFAITYGLPTDKGWVGDPVGFAEHLRPVFADQAAGCGLDVGADRSLTGFDPTRDYDAARVTDGTEATVARPTGSNLALTAQLVAIPQPGADVWDQQVAPRLLAAFDRDRSGKLDTTAEVSAITCDVWQALDANLRTHLRALYGFADGYGWVGYALGFAENMRATADAYAAACGLP